MRRAASLWTAGVSVGLLLLCTSVAEAATITVTSHVDETSAADSPVSLREALLSINGGGDTGADVAAHRTGPYGVNDTVLVPAQATHYMVTLGELPITKPLTIQGAGATLSVIDAQGSSRVFKITGVSSASAVTFQSLTITGGNATSLPGGGGIEAEGASLSLISAAVDGNTAALSAGTTSAVGGAGIYNNAGNVTVTASSVSNNTATISTTSGCCEGGAGIYNNAGSTTVSSGSLLNGNKVTITGPTSDAVSCCDGGGAIYQDVDADTAISASTLNGNSVKITGSACCHGGGAVFQDSKHNPVNVSGSTINNNSVTVNGPTDNTAKEKGHCCSGGGAIAGFRDFSVINSTLDGNSATITAGDCCHGGGALFPNAATGTTVTGSRLSGNTTTVSGSGCCHGGGAITTFSGLSLNSSALTGNTAAITAGDCCNGGGAIQIDSGAGVAATATLISGNHSNITGSTLSGGGGVYEDTGGGTSINTYTNSTISDNTTNAANPRQGGGGLYLLNGSATLPDVLANSTIAGNSAPSGSGGGILSAGGKLSSKNSIVALNTATTGGNCFGFILNASPAMFSSLGYNLQDGSNACGFSGSSDKVVATSAVRLAALSNNGGPTQTRALLPGSPAIDGGNPLGCTNPFGGALTADQRGVARPDQMSTACDIGAFEFPSPLVVHKTKCVVPKLKGKTLKSAKKALKKAHCRLGKVKPKGRKKGKVKKQKPKPGTVRPAGSKVNVKLR